MLQDNDEKPIDSCMIFTNLALVQEEFLCLIEDLDQIFAAWGIDLKTLDE